jgi:putative transcriptional regulator
MRTGIDYELGRSFEPYSGKIVMSEIGRELKETMAQMASQARAKRQAARTHHVISANEIQSARKRLGLSQEQFADVFGVSASSLRKWEQGQYTPSGAAKALLKVIAVEPDAVLRALAITSTQGLKRIDAP